MITYKPKSKKDRIKDVTSQIKKNIIGVRQSRDMSTFNKFLVVRVETTFIKKSSGKLICSIISRLPDTTFSGI